MRTRATLIKFAIFAVVMAMLTAFLFFIFGQYRTGSTTGYSAVFTDVSRLKPGQSVRVAGVRVGTVDSVSLQPDKKVVVKFDADRDIVLTEGTRAAVRYLNLVGDRYLELVDGPGSTTRLAAGGQIPVSRTAPALDLDLLLGEKPRDELMPRIFGRRIDLGDGGEVAVRHARSDLLGGICQNLCLRRIAAQ